MGAGSPPASGRTGLCSGPTRAWIEAVSSHFIFSREHVLSALLTFRFLENLFSVLNHYGRARQNLCWAVDTCLVEPVQFLYRCDGAGVDGSDTVLSTWVPASSVPHSREKKQAQPALLEGMSEQRPVRGWSLEITHRRPLLTYVTGNFMFPKP